MHGSVLERLQSRIDLERLSKLLYARRISVEVTFVVFVTANGVVPQAAMLTLGRASRLCGTHERLCREPFCFSDSASWMMPDMSLP